MKLENYEFRLDGDKLIIKNTKSKYWQGVILVV